jgi:peptidyl-prolyl cis-trans isomerase SurA
MVVFKSSITSLLLCLLIQSGAAGQGRNGEAQVLFSVDKKPIMTDEFIYLYRKNHQNKPDEFTEDKIEEYLKLFIHYKLKVEEALSRGLDTTAGFKKEFNTYRDELLKPHLPDARIIDSLVRLTYDRLKEEVRASHILVKLKPDATPADTLAAYDKAVSLSKRIANGETFTRLAAEYPRDPDAEIFTETLGYFTAMQMVFPFEQAAFTTPVGKVSSPVRTQFGYHLVSVTDRRPSRGEVEVSHIMIRTGDGADNDEAKNTIFDVYDRLQKGMNWEELCEQYSEDPNSKDNGGRLRPFGVGAMASVPEFEQMAFSLQNKGDISDPFQTQFGWHILRLESKIPLPPFEEIKPSLTTRVTRDERVQISKQALRERMRVALGYTEYPEIKSQIFTLADTSLSKGSWKPSLTNDLKEKVLFSMQGQLFRVKDFVSYVQSHRKNNTLPPAQYLSELFTNYVDATQMQLLEEKIKAQSPDYKWLLKEYYEGILLFEIMEKEVWNKATQDTVGQRKYFNEHREKYKAQDRIAGRIYASASKKSLLDLQPLLNDDSAAAEFVRRNKVREESGPFEKQDRPVLSKITWSPGIQLAENNGMNYLIFIEKILPPMPKTFQEARSSVISDYQTNLEETWVATLKEKFKVKINKKARKAAFQELMK